MASATVYRTASAGFPTRYQPSTSVLDTEAALQTARELGVSDAEFKRLLRRYRPAL